MKFPLAAIALAAGAGAVHAQGGVVERVVVTGGGVEQRLFDTPYAIGTVDAADLRAAGPMINVSEALVRVPGLVVNDRHNYAQDLQISSRGFGARTAFGVRGLRLYADGIPLSGPDGQGQVSNFDLAGAARIEVLRGPYSALYGNSSGGVISLVSAAPTERRFGLDVDAGSHGLSQFRTTLEGPIDGGYSLRASASHLDVDGFRPQSSAQRTLGNVRLGWDGDADRVVAIANAVDQPAQDPLGLTRQQFDADPHQTTPQATQFDTRKRARQTQAGVAWTHRFGDAGPLASSRVAAWSGERSVVQWQSIPPATQAAPRQSGGVIDFDRRFDGVDARLAWRWSGVRLVTGGAVERQQDDRRGHENFVGTGAAQRLGVTGRLRRDEDNRATTRDLYAQADVDVAPTVVATVGVRSGTLSYETRDRYLANGDDSGSLEFDYTTPVVALRWQPTSTLMLHASAGRGFEAPTLNELAYRADGSGGFNTALSPQRSRQIEVGAKWRPRPTLAIDAALFDARTDDEIGVQTNSGGRATFGNVGRTTRRGVEIDARWQPLPRWSAQLALTVLDATYRDGFLVCAATPCTVPTVPVAAGNEIAGTVPRSVYAEVAWQPIRDTEIALEVRGQGAQPVDDRNTDFAGGHGRVALRLQHALPLGPGRLGLLVRVENLADRIVAGSVIVNEGNGRYFEPTPGRTWLLSARWSAPF